MIININIHAVVGVESSCYMTKNKNENRAEKVIILMLGEEIRNIMKDVGSIIRHW